MCGSPSASLTTWGRRRYWPRTRSRRSEAGPACRSARAPWHRPERHAAALGAAGRPEVGDLLPARPVAGAAAPAADEVHGAAARAAVRPVLLGPRVGGI